MNSNLDADFAFVGVYGGGIQGEEVSNIVGRSDASALGADENPNSLKGRDVAF